MKKSVAPAARECIPEDSVPPGRPPTARRLVAKVEMDRIRDLLTLAGAAETADCLHDAAARHTEYLERCAEEAESVLSGDLAAGTRLWLLLRNPIDLPRSIPTSILQQAAGGRWDGPPMTVSGETLLRLIAGVVRGANQPPEVDTMLRALGRLLQPFLYLDAAGAAAERARHGDHQPLRTFTTARSARGWRESINPPADPVFSGDSGASTDFKERVPFDLSTWKDALGKDSIGEDWATGWVCPGGTRLGMSQIDRFGPRYTLDSISNTQACPGETITLKGHGFGQEGRVYFESPNPKDPAFALGAGDSGLTLGVKAKRWTETDIDVVVPPWATAGEIHLNSFKRHSDLCATIDVYRLGNALFFAGGLASVYQVTLGLVEVDLSSTRRTNLAPGDSVALTWHSSGGPTTRIHIELTDDQANVLWRGTNLPGGFGGTVLTIPTRVAPAPATLTFNATSACGATGPLRIPIWLSVPPKLTIEYIEVTQGVQGDLADVLAGRSMPTVANKDTAVRVHMNCNRNGWWLNQLENITGYLLVGGIRLQPTNVGAIPSQRGFANVMGLSNPGITNNTLNFTIPAAWATAGPHTLTVHLVCNDPSGRITTAQSVQWAWQSKSAMRVRALHMGLYGSKAHMLEYLRDVLDFLPTAITDIGIAAPEWHPHTYDLGDPDERQDLLDDLEDAWDDADEDSDVRWIGIVPAYERFHGMSPTWGGLSGTPSIAVLAVGDQPESGAHELGHSYGLHHVNLPTEGDFHPKSPYDPADNNGYHRRPAFDVRKSVAVPLPVGDLMSYFNPGRPGITTWMRLFLNT
jgi:hypothetical protein